MNDWALGAIFVVAGMVVGLAYFALVRRTARQLASGEVRVAGAIGSGALRLALFAPGAVVAASLTLAALAGYMVGFIAARVVVVRVWTAS
ncbi:MAG: hypothetical protein JW889_08110 [Verrucomicrobia bacterium]|nr:hypothetical protein [Verrucomicrobiota bacterium]